MLRSASRPGLAGDSQRELESRKIERKAGSASAVMTSGRRRSISDGLRLLIDEGRKGLKLDHDVSFDQVAAFSLLREAQRELGIREK